MGSFARHLDPKWSMEPGRRPMALRRPFWPPQGRPTADDSLGRSYWMREGKSGSASKKNYYREKNLIWSKIDLNSLLGAGSAR